MGKQKQRKSYERTGILPKKKTTTKDGKREYQKLYMRQRRQKKPKKFKRKEFKTLLDVVMEDPNKPKVKYQNPDRWRG